MKKIGFLYNIRNNYPDINDKNTRYDADYSDYDEIKLMIDEIKQIGYEVLPIEANKNAYQKLEDNKDELLMVINYSEGMSGADREAQFPAIMELLSIPYSGSKPLAQSLMLNKAKCNEILKANGISTLENVVIKEIEDINKYNYSFPQIIKPLSQGSSIAITNESIVHNLEELKKQVKIVLGLGMGDVLIEQYIEGKEFYVSMLGNSPKILPILEADYSLLSNDYKPINSFEVKRKYSNDIIKPAEISSKLKLKIEILCKKARNALGILDWCRFDIRCDENNNPYILEINSPAGLTPSKQKEGYSSYFVISAQMAGLSFQDIIKDIIKSTLERYKKII